MIVSLTLRSKTYQHSSCKSKIFNYSTYRNFERYCNVLPVFGLDNAKYDRKPIISYLLAILVNERDIEPTVKKKPNQFGSFKFSDIQLLDIMNFLGGAKSLYSFLEAYTN